VSRLGHVRRRPDHWATPHDRAKSRAAERLDGPLGLTETAWLDEHLAGCEPCLTAAQGFEADRLSLRALRDTPPEPPRDLWARTSAAIEQEAAGHRRASTGSRRTSPLAQWTAVAGIAVVGLVVGTSFLQGGWLDVPAGTTHGLDGSGVAVITPPTATDIAVIPGATPMTVNAGKVGWFDVGADGSYAYNIARVDEVCAQADRSNCAALDNGTGRQVALSSAPKSIITSPSTGQAVVVGSDGSGGNDVFVVALPGDPDATPTPAPTDTPIPTDTPAPTSSPVATATPESTGSPDPSTVPPSDPPSPTPSPTEVASPSPELTPSPTAAALAIVSDVTVVGDSAAFSPDGAWFAFTARPADGSAGPDIYLWRVGDAKALAVTTDHRSAFASWVGGLAIGSRPDPLLTVVDGLASPAPDVQPITFSIDPTTGVETQLAVRGWRPAVAPTGDRAVVWKGSVSVSEDGTTVTPAVGGLVVADWSPDADEVVPTGSAAGSGPFADFTVRWDESGTWLAVWLADLTDPTVGRLSLLHIDAETGEIDRPEAGPQDVPALPGFSIEDGRLAWATPPSQDGEGSRVQIVAWTADGVGSIESAPGQEVVVVR
jgi:hypothetical protein